MMRKFSMTLRHGCGKVLSFGDRTVYIRLVATALLLAGGGKAWGQPDTLWTREYSYPPDFFPYDIQWSIQGNILVSGQMQGTQSFDMFVLRLDGDGNFLSLTQYGLPDSDEEAGGYLRRAAGGGYGLAGNTRGQNRRCDFYLARLDEEGALLWERTYGVAVNSEDFGGFAATQDGGFVLAGDGHWGAWPMAIRVDANGEPLWDREYQFTSYGMAKAIVQTADGGFAMTGFASTDNASVQVFFAKLDSAGYLSNLHFFGANRSEEGRDIVQSNDGGFLIVGRTNSYSENAWDMIVLRLNENGDSLWARVFPCGFLNVGHHCRELSDGSFIVQSICLYLGSWYLSLTRLNSNSQTIWQGLYPVGAEFYHAGLDIDLSNRYLMCAERLWDRALIILTQSDTTLSFAGTPMVPGAYDMTLSVFPNPFNSTVTIRFELPEMMHVKLELFNLLGQKVATLVDQPSPAGLSSFQWDARSAASGVYVYRLVAGTHIESHKLLLLR